MKNLIIKSLRNEEGKMVVLIAQCIFEKNKIQQYVVGYGFNPVKQDWEHGHYFYNYEEAFEYFKTYITDEMLKEGEQ